MTPGSEDQRYARRSRAPRLAARAQPQCIDLPLGTHGTDFYFTLDGRLIALPRKQVTTRIRNAALKGLTVVGFVAAAAVCGVVLA